MRPEQIALQLYTVRRPMAADLRGTVEAVAKAGYRAVEVAGVPNDASTELAAALSEADLRVVAAHESLEGLRADFDAVAGRLAQLGSPRVIVPSLPAVDRADVAAVRAVARELGAVGTRLTDHGIRLGYHNHDLEFAPMDGTTMWQVLLDELPPEVEIELDVYWAAFAGRDPVAEIEAASGRVRLLHMKDRTAGPEPRDAPPGAGVLPFPDIVRAGRAAGVEWYIVEQDEPHDALADITTGLRHLEALAG
jgi:sugar phosphate isomerase/epimerase